MRRSPATGPVVEDVGGNGNATPPGGAVDARCVQPAGAGRTSPGAAILDAANDLKYGKRVVPRRHVLKELVGSLFLVQSTPACACNRALLRASGRPTTPVLQDNVVADPAQSQLSAPPVWYSMTRVSKKFFSFLRSIISDIHGNGLFAPG